MTIELYTAPTPNGRKVSIALEELGIPYTVHAVDLDAGEQFDESFRAISPNNRIPAIVDRDNGMALMESGAILLYLATKAGRLLPREGEPYWRTLEWLMWQMGGVGPMFGQAHHFLRFNRGRSEYAEARYLAETERLYGVLDHRLGHEPFLAGEYTITDIATWPWVSRYEWQTIDLAGYPNVKRWYLTIARRAAVERGYHVPRFVNEIPIPA